MKKIWNCGKLKNILERNRLIDLLNTIKYFKHNLKYSSTCQKRDLETIIYIRKYLKKDPNISIENIHGKGFKMNV